MSRTNGGNKKGKRISEEPEKTKKYKVKASKTKKEKKEKKTKKKHKILRKIFLFFFLMIVLAVLILGGIIAGIFFSDKFKLTEEDLKISNMNGVIKDINGEDIGVLSGDENRKIVTFDNMPEYLPKAFVAIEDKRFYDHNGVDIKRTAYATIMYALHKGDSSSGGGSTITQQLIKNMMNDKDDSGAAGVERKIREMARAYNVEKILSKDQILELYLNKIFMGSTVYGVGMAAEYYFNKPVAELDLAQCAFLAGINNTPNSYNPFSSEEDNSDLIKRRTKEVLYQMKDQGYITDEEEYKSAVEEVENGLAFSRGSIASRASYSYHTAAAVNQVIEDIMKEKEVNEDTAKFMIYNNGYTIYTTQDTTIQKRMEEEFKKDKYIKSGVKKDSDGNLLNNHTQAAMVLIDHKTGKVLATVGGLGSDSNSVGLNRATQSKKQTGSSIKPLACEAPALEKGIITAATVYDDSPTSFGSYTPGNSGGYSGLITVRTAMAESSNVVHVKIMRELGPANSRAFLAQLGIDIDPIHEALPMALGAGEVSPLNMAAAYAAVANNGEYITPVFYTKVEDSNGNVVVESKQETRRVMSEANAYILQNLLTAPVRSGTATTCAMSNFDVGAKTGSTNHYIDRWLCGFTPYYTAACWFGFDYTESPVFSGNNAMNIWAAVMKDIHKNLSSARFKRPSNVVSATICQDSGCIATDSCTRKTTEVFVRGTLPKECEGHQKVQICKETGKIANEYCTDTEEKVFLTRPAKEEKKLWSTNEGDKYKMPEEICDVHKAPEQVEMIDVIGKKVDEAKKAIEKIGLKVEIINEENKSKTDGIVLKQSVKEKDKIEKGKTVILTVNKLTSKDNKTNEISNANEVVDNNNTIDVNEENTPNTNTVD